MPDEGLSTEGIIEIEVILKNYQKASRDLNDLNESLGGSSKEVQRLTDLLRPADDAAARFGKTLKGEGDAARAQVADFDALTRQLREFIQAHRDAAQLGVVGGSLSGTNQARLEAMSTAELKQYIAIDDARGVNAVSVARKIVGARESETQQEKAAVEALANFRSKTIAENIAAEEKATAVSLALAKKQQDAYTAAYTAELNAALRVDEQIAAAQQARRYAPGGLNTASRNTANPTAMMAAQQEYAAQETKQLSAALREQEGAARASGGGITSLAYSLFNLSFMAGTASAGLIAMDVATIKTAADYQREFADVARTSGVAGVAADMLKQSLIELSTAIPVTFGDIAKIGTLAGQLDIQAADIENFTKATAMFSATSNVGVDDAATALGRLGQLLPDVEGNYERLASTILKVGVTSVATESQIIAISTQVAGLAVGARLTTPDVIALSAALASVGVQPERSRGLVTRLFTNIEVAVASGSKRLQDFGAISGQTAQQFATSWKTAPMSAIAGLLDGIKAQGDGAINTMKALGIASARDIPAIQNLIAQPGLLRKEMAESSGEWTQQTELTKQFGVIADTVSSRLTVLQNNFKAMLDAAGSSANGPFIELINGLDDFLKLATKVISSPVGQWFTVAGIGAVALTGALLAAAAAAAITAAGFLLVKSALDKEAISATAAAVATNVFKGALVTTGVGALVVLLGTLVGGIMAVNGAFDSGADRAEKYFGSIDGITQGMQADQAIYEKTGQAIQQIGTEQGTATVHANDWVQGLHDATGAQVQLNGNTSHTTEAIKKQTVAYGENAQAALRSALANSRTFQDLFNNKDANANMKMAGGNFGDFSSAIAGDPVKGGQEYVDKMVAAMAAELQAKTPGLSSKFATARAEAFLAPFREAASAAADLAGSSANKIAFLNATQDEAAKSTGAWSDQVKDAAGNLVSLSDQVHDNINALYDGVNAQLALQSSTEALGEAFYNNGAAAASQGSEIQAVINNIVDASAGPQDAANMLQGFYNALINGAGASVDSLDILAQAIASLGGSSNPTAFDMTPFIQGQNKARIAAQKTGSAARGAAKQVHTLVDYANDLQSVFSRSFDLRFGGQQGMDAVSSGWATIRDNIESTNEQIRQYRDDMASLTADKKVKEYWLSVAENYGDALRAGELRAELGKIDGDLAKDSKDLSKAQEKNSKTLVGNSEAATENRDEILGLVKNYEGYITALASSGMSQADLSRKTAQLKADFIAQATQLGFNQNELGQYANAFDDVATAINKVPRNITVGFNADPALQALAEFAAKAATAGSAAGAGFAGGVQEGMAKAARGAQLQAQIASWQATLNRAVASGADNQGQRALDNITRLSALLNSGNYWSGGYVGDGGKYQPMGIVHGGEFVFTKEETAAIGPQNLQNLASMAFSHNMSKGSSAPAAGTSSGFGSGVVQLSPYDRQLLIDIRDRQGITISGTALQRTASAGNINSNNRGAA